MRIIVTLLALLLTSCSSAHQAGAATSRCKTPEQIAAEAESALLEAEQRMAAGDTVPTQPEEHGKSPAELAEQAAIAGEPCPAASPIQGAEELPQIN